MFVWPVLFASSVQTWIYVMVDSDILALLYSR